MDGPYPRMNPATVLVTGGNGFLGRAVVERCLARGYAVRVYGRSDLAADLALRVTFHRGDLADATALTAAVQGCDYVNASWISNNVFLQTLPTFIAAQGPLVQSLPHFLQMILENKVSVVVMLTEISEKGDALKLWMRI